MTTLDDRQGITPANIPATRPKRSGCALGHYAEECDCVRPEAAEQQRVGCRECWGDGSPCGACGGWGETYRYGGRISNRAAGSGETGPSSTYDPWADLTPWVNPDHAEEPPF